MKQETLELIRDKVFTEKMKCQEYNKKIRRIKALEKTKLVQEYLNLIDSEINAEEEVDMSIDKIIDEVCYRYSYQIKDDETNHIYIYMGTYKPSYEVDIVHGVPDISVEYNDPSAVYSEFKNIENGNEECIRIIDREKFIANNIVLDVSNYYPCSLKKFYELQKLFFINAVKYNEEIAVKKLVKTTTKFKR